MADATATMTRKDFVSDQEVRWCPGCGDYAILAQMQRVLPELGIPKEQMVFVSGIGCSSRFPYYMNTYGIHSIHGRAPTLATGLKVANPDLHVWVITGDGDGLSIGGNHLLHLLRRNVNLNIILFNNRIYGLTKGQYSPTSLPGHKTKSSPMGSIEQSFNPTSVAIGAEATFVARTADRNTKHLAEILRRAAEHKGTSFVEVYQNCNIFNDGAWLHVTEAETKDDNTLILEDGEPMMWFWQLEGVRWQLDQPSFKLSAQAWRRMNESLLLGSFLESRAAPVPRGGDHVPFHVDRAVPRTPIGRARSNAAAATIRGSRCWRSIMSKTILSEVIVARSTMDRETIFEAAREHRHASADRARTHMDAVCLPTSRAYSTVMRACVGRF